MTNATAIVGHNNPPSDLDIVLARLSESEATLRQGIAFPAPPETIADEHEAGRVTDIIRASRQ
jgi:hypothetical protein